MTEIVIRGGTLVDADGRRQSDIACDDGCISRTGAELPGGREEIDARGLIVMPALIDVHLHFNEPGRTEWEGAATGSRALAVGGGTLFFDMPLNSTPCTITPDAFDRKRAALEASSITDFALWGGLVPGSVIHMADMAARGVVGFKAFMCDSGLTEFPRADDETLAAGMTEAARLGLPVAVHAEDEDIVRQRAEQWPVRDVKSFVASRPIAAELRAISRALSIAADTRAALHIVHISSGAGVILAAEARARGVNVSIETCPHYLAFTDEDLERLGSIAKCAPPLRPAAAQAALWDHVLDGDVDIIASDHSPTEPTRKQGPFADTWGGIAGVQSTLSVLLDRSFSAADLPLERIVSLTATTPARRFGIAGKGALTVGHDADLLLIEPTKSFTLAQAQLRQRHPTSPYVGRHFHGIIRRTIRRGETIALDGEITARTRGHFVAPARTHA